MRKEELERGSSTMKRIGTSIKQEWRALTAIGAAVIIILTLLVLASTVWFVGRRADVRINLFSDLVGFLASATIVGTVVSVWRRSQSRRLWSGIHGHLKTMSEVSIRSLESAAVQAGVVGWGDNEPGSMELPERLEVLAANGFLQECLDGDGMSFNAIGLNGEERTRFTQELQRHMDVLQRRVGDRLWTLGRWPAAVDAIVDLELVVSELSVLDPFDYGDPYAREGINRFAGKFQSTLQEIWRKASAVHSEISQLSGG